MEVEVKVSDESIDKHVQTLVAKTVFDALTPEKKDELMQGAIMELLGKSWDREKNNRITNIFIDVAEKEARRIAETHIESPEVQARIHELVVAATTQALAMGDEYDKNKNAVVEKITTGIVSAMLGSRY